MARDFAVDSAVDSACCRGCDDPVQEQVGRFDGVNTESIATLDASTAKTQLMFSMLTVAGLIAGHWLT
ncbi:hypothetical protein DW133_08775 [Sutterella sp. AM11-39]|nr:hypothetical protein DW133_08775 [Sutterella sp. AM11-39]